MSLRVRLFVCQWVCMFVCVVFGNVTLAVVLDFGCIIFSYRESSRESLLLPTSAVCVLPGGLHWTMLYTYSKL